MSKLISLPTIDISFDGDGLDDLVFLLMLSADVVGRRDQ